MSDEKRRVLEMLAAGTITEGDAARLLDALGESRDGVPAGKPVPELTLCPDGGEEMLEQAAQVEQEASKLNDAIDSAVEQAVNISAEAGEFEKMGEAISDAVNQAINESFAAMPPIPPMPPVPPEPPVPPVPPAPPKAPEETAAQYPCPAEGSFLAGHVDSLKINWVAGPVEIRTWEGDSPRISEYAKRPLEENERLWFSYDDGEMEIRWTKDGRTVSKGGFLKRGVWSGMSTLSKRLVVELPQSLGTLEELKVNSASGSVLLENLNVYLEDADINTASGALTLSGLHGESLRFNTASGSITADHIAGEDVHLNSASGCLYLEQLTGEELYANSASGSMNAEGIHGETIKLTTVSGSLNAKGLSGEEIKLSTVSGSLSAEGTCENMEASTVSGRLYVRTMTMPEAVKLSSVSGAVQLDLPESAGDGGFTVEYKTTSGSFRSEFPLTGKLDKKSGSGEFGDGETEIRISTMSGGIQLCKA